MARQREQLDPDRYVTLWVLAQMLGVSERTLWRRIKAGFLIRPTHPGKPARWDMEALIRHAELVDPYLSCRLAGEVGRLREHRKQWTRLFATSGAARVPGQT